MKERIRRRGRNLVRGSQSASDVAQEAVLGLLKVRTPPRFEDPRALRAYLWRAAWRLCLARMQRPGRRAVRLDRTRLQALADALVTTRGLRRGEEEERRVALDLALNLLQPREREILDLFYFQRRSLEEVAQRVGVSHEAAKKRLARARSILAKKLGSWTDLIG